MQVADIISWSLGRFACFHKREVALCICVCLCVRMLRSQSRRGKRVSNGHNSLWFQTNKKAFIMKWYCCTVT